MTRECAYKDDSCTAIAPCLVPPKAFSMKFIADVMLGRLAKRMRLLGFDVLYHRSLNDRDIIMLSLEQDRIILTRDRALTQRPLASHHIFIRSETIHDQITQVLSLYPLTSCTSALTRCSTCNALLAAVKKHEVYDIVPEFVYSNHDVFLRCPSCCRIYWKGSHLRRMGISKEGKRN